MAQGIAVHQRIMFESQLRHRMTVHEQPRRCAPIEPGEEARHRAVHRERGRPPDVQLVNFADRGRGDADGAGVLADVEGQRVAPPLREGLAVADAGHRGRADGKDNGRGHHWSSQGAAACFVHADEEPPIRPAPRLVGERGAEGRHRA